jgi:hypothetical protein
MLAIGNNELGAFVKKGAYVSRGKLKGHLEYGTNSEGVEVDTLGFITTEEGKSYLVSIRGQLLKDWEVIV